jgi:hypothetical protein
MPFRYPSARIHEIVSEAKAIRDGQNVYPPKKKGSDGLSFRVDLDLLEGPFLDLEFYGKAGVKDIVTSYDSTLMLEKERIRGIGHNATGRKNLKSKRSIPSGWHENVVDPNRSTNDPAYNDHRLLSDFNPREFEDFTRKIAEHWNIDLNWEPGLL